AALADILAGYSYFAPFTLVIKGLEGAIVGIIYTKMKRGFIMKLVIAWIVGGLVMVVGYFISEYLFLGYGDAAFVEIPFNITQMLVAGIVGIPLAIALQRVLKI
ncbi:MAG: ECF transporter S component, partial [Candidatus Bathyarchaeia archaeon]